MVDRPWLKAISVVLATACATLVLVVALVPGPFMQCRVADSAVIEDGSPARVIHCDDSWWPLGAGP
jgi:hypothetical protein